MSQLNFAKHIGLSQTSLSTIECGRSRLTDKNVKLICKTFNISEYWLRTGNGEMLSASPHEKEFQEIFNRLLPDTQEYLLLVARELLKVQDKLASHFNAAHSENGIEVADDEDTK
jgi:transcriptional regulator with XRE-family HTH domain